MLKILFSFVCIFTTIIGTGRLKLLERFDKNIENEVIVNSTEEIQNEAQKPETIQNTVVENNKNNSSSSNSIKQETTTNEKQDDIIKSEESSNIQINENTIDNVESTTNNGSQEIEEEVDNIVENEPIVEEKKIEYVYNKTETDRMINAVNEIAKQNANLWAEDGGKLYRVEVNSEAMKGNYFSPYRDNQIAAKVLNTFSVTFYVYAVDYTVNGTVQHTRYYISVAQY